jgi:adenylate cyclase
MKLQDLSAHLSKRKRPAENAGTPEEPVLKDGENRFVAILFADVKGFTAMSEKLEPEVVHSLLDQLMVSFSEGVEKYGGYIDKYEGDRIMAHFGSVRFLEQNSRRAVYAGLELVDVVKEFNQLKPEIEELATVDIELAIRVGIDNGVVTTGKVGLKREGDFTTYGDTVNVASRMESMGGINRVMVPAWVQKELAKYFFFEFNARMEVKGKSQPISTYFVKGINHSQVARAISRSKFLGRVKELGLLSAIYNRNRPHYDSPRPGGKIDVIGIKAPAGMGKTRFVREFMQSLPAGACFHSEISPFDQPPLSSMVALLRNLFGIRPNHPQEVALAAIRSKWDEYRPALPEALAQLVEGTTPLLLHLLGYPVEDVHISPEQDERTANLHFALLLLLQATALHAAKKDLPLLLFFDDLHWTDEASLSALDFVVRNISHFALTDQPLQAGVLVLLAYRDGFIPSSAILHQARFTLINLQELSSYDTNRFLCNLLPGIKIPVSVKKTLHEKSAGNPLFLEEWVDSVRNMLSRGEEVDFEKLVIPNNIVSLVLGRLNSFEKPTVRVLQNASVIGARFSRPVLADLEISLGVDIELAEHLNQLADLEVLIKEDSVTAEENYSFRHQLIRDAVYETILKSNQRILHGLIAGIIEKRYDADLKDYFFQLAEHFDRAKDCAKCVEYLKKSEQLARQRFMNKKSLQLCEKLLSYCRAEDRVDIQLRQMSIYLDTGDYSQTKSTLDQIRITENTAPLLRDKCILGRVRLLQATGEWEKALSYLRRTIAHITHESSLMTAKIYLMDLRRLLRNDPGFERDALDLLAQLSGFPVQTARLVNIIGLYYKSKGDYTNALEYFHQSIRNASENKSILRWAYHNTANVLTKLGEKDKAVEMYHKALTIARMMDDIGGCGHVLSDLGSLYMTIGESSKALSMFRESLDIAKATGSLLQQGLATYNIAVNHFYLENFAKAREALKESIRICKAISDLSGLSHANDLLGDILYTEGFPVQARKVYSQNLKLQEQIGDCEGIAHTNGNLGNIAADEKDYLTAEKCYRQQQEALHEIGDLEGEGKAWCNWGLIEAEQGRTEAAVEKLTEALNLFEKAHAEIYIDTVKEYLENLRLEIQHTI